MKKRKKTVLWIFGTLLVLLIALLLSINTIVHRILVKKVDNAIEKTDSLLISYGEISVDVFTGRMDITDVMFQTDKLPTDSFRAFSKMNVKLVKLEGVSYKSLLYDREIDLKGILVKGITYSGILDTKAMAARDMADAISAEQKRQIKALLHEAQKYLKRVTLRRLAVRDAKMNIRALETGLRVDVGRLNTAFYDLGYNLRDSIPFHLNDSVMNLYIKGIKVRMPDSLMNLSVSSVYSTHHTRGLVVTGIKFATDTIHREDRDYHEVSVDTFRLDNIAVPDMNKKRSLSVKSIRIINCDYFGCINDKKRSKEKKKKIVIDNIDFANIGFETKEAKYLAKLKQRENEMMTKQKKKLLNMVQMWLDEIDLGYFSVENTNMHLKSYKSSLDVKAQDINLSFCDLSYSLIEKKPYSFNENVYRISIGPMSVTMPDGLLTLECNGFEHKNCGPMTVGKTRIYNTVNKWRLAHIKGDVSSTWVDFTLDTFYTSSFSPFKTFYKGELKMDSVTAIIGDLYMFVDNRNLTIKEINLPSKRALLEIKKLFSIGLIRVGANNIKADLTGPYANPGYFSMRNAIVSIKDTLFQKINVEDFIFKFPDTDMRLEIGDIHTNWELEGLVVQNVSFRTSDDFTPGEQYHKIDIDSVVLEGILLPDFKTNTNIAASCLRIVHPVYTAFVDEKPDRSKKEESYDDVNITDKRRKEYKQAQLRNTMDILQEWLDNAQLQKIKLNDADVNVHSIRSGFSIQSHDMYLHLSGMRFNIDHFMPMNLKDTNMTFDPIKNNFNMLGKNAITYLSLRNLHATLPDSSMFLNVRKVTTDVNSKSLIITGVQFATDTVIPDNEMYHDVDIDSIRLDGIILPDLKEQKEASLSNLRIINACYYGQIDEKRKKAKKKKESINGVEVDEETNEEISEEERRKTIKHDRAMKIIGQWFEGASLDAISVENANAKVLSISSALDLDIKGFNLQLNDISYEIDNVKSFSNNDSVYYFGFDHADILLPDSSMIIEVNNLRHENTGPLSMGRTRIMNTVDKWEIAHTKGDVPTTWMKMVIDTVHTSDINPFRIVETAGKVRLDSITAVVDTMYIFRDIRYKPKKPYSMPHKPLMTAPAKIGEMFNINVADATINNMEIDLPKTDDCIMKMAFQDIHGNVYDINTKENNVITIDGDAHWGGGTAHADITMPLMKEYPWEISLVARNIDMHCMDSLLYPIAGLTVGGKINEMKTILSGDSVNAQGYLSLAYDGLDIMFHKESPTPIKFIKKNTKFLTGVARAFVSKRNPKRKGHLPLAYQAKAINDVWQPSAVFMMGPVIKGVVYTMLPGLFVHKRVDQDKLIIKYKFKEEK